MYKSQAIRIVTDLVDAAFNTGYYQGKLETKEYQTDTYKLKLYTTLNASAIDLRRTLVDLCVDLLQNVELEQDDYQPIEYLP